MAKLERDKMVNHKNGTIIGGADMRKGYFRRLWKMQSPNARTEESNDGISFRHECTKISTNSLCLFKKKYFIANQQYACSILLAQVLMRVPPVSCCQEFCT